jgi:hypothetical protein
MYRHLRLDSMEAVYLPWSSVFPCSILLAFHNSHYMT